jgi:GT2 family glycosyltransferase
MYDAINKGIRRANGNIIGLLNTDDLYAEGAFQNVVAAFEANPGVGAVVGGATVFKSEGENRKTIRVHSYIQPEELWKRLTIGSPITNAWFFRDNVFRAIGTFKTEYSYSADRDFLLRFALSNTPWSSVKRIIYHYRQHQGSVTISHLNSRSIERAYIRKRVLGEGLDVSEALLKNFDLPPRARQYIRRWHGDMAYRLSAMSLYHYWWSPAWRAAWRGCRMDVLWPFLFVRMGLIRLCKLICERLGIIENSV